MSNPPPSSSHPPPPHFDVPAVLSPAEITAALRDLSTAVQEIHLYLAGPSRPPPTAPLAATIGPLLLPWQPPHLAVSAKVPATTLPWLPWPSQPLAGPVAVVASLQQPAPPLPWLPWPSQSRRGRGPAAAAGVAATQPRASYDHAGRSSDPTSLVPTLAVIASVFDRYPPCVGVGEAAGCFL
nr:predicted GPI-anchored protein 58 [Lolium perenne]